jgi:hypothetical protein
MIRTWTPIMLGGVLKCLSAYVHYGLIVAQHHCPKLNPSWIRSTVVRHVQMLKITITLDR